VVMRGEEGRAMMINKGDILLGKQILAKII
jgi:hypothetical protein